MPKKPVAGTQAGPEWSDPDDAPELTAAFFDAAEAFNGDVFVRRGRGRPPTGNAKEQISVRLDQDVLSKLRAAGSGWQTQVNALLREALGLQREEPAEPQAVAGRSLARLKRAS